MNAYKFCSCGNRMSPIDDDGDRFIYEQRCPECQTKVDRRGLEFAKMLAEADEPQCMRFMSYIVQRLEYLKRNEELARTGYVAS